MAFFGDTNTVVTQSGHGQRLALCRGAQLWVTFECSALATNLDLSHAAAGLARAATTAGGAIRIAGGV